MSGVFHLLPPGGDGRYVMQHLDHAAIFLPIASPCVRPLFFGGLAYTEGAVLDFVPFPDIIPGILGRHELFHVAILAGVGWHWRLIWVIADGSVHDQAREAAIGHGDVGLSALTR
jgi:predicted membrane channel-forming protein YqfA (hemolysin III family)